MKTQVNRLAEAYVATFEGAADFCSAKLVEHARKLTTEEGTIITGGIIAGWMLAYAPFADTAVS